jgi:hypothetical protein
MIQPCDTRPAVTLGAPGANRDQQFPVTAPQPISITCTFQRGEIAVVQVHGATDEAQALHVVARQAFPRQCYSVALGDPTGGRAEPFYMWVCNDSDRQAADQDQEDQKRNTMTLRNEGGHQPTDEGALNGRDYQ